MKTPLLHTESYGSGPTVVLLHGFLASSKYWDKVTELVSKNNRVISIDLLGFGKSPKPRCSKYDYDAHIQSINRTLYSLNIREPFTLVGHSMGALIALRYTNRYSDRVKRLVLTNMPIMIGANQVKDTFFKANIIFRLGLSPVSHTFMWMTFRTLYRLKVLPKRAKGMIGRHGEYLFSHNAVSRLKSFRRVIMQAKTEVDLARVNVQTTVLSGFDDKKVYIENLLHNVQPSPSVILRNFKTGHHIPLVMPQIVVDSIEQ